MTEKYKIYLLEDTRTRLINDAELFEFSKKDGSVNLNAFLKTLIINYFDQYRFDSERLLINITNDLKSMTSIDDKDAEFIAEKIISTYVKPDDKHSSKNIALSLTVSGSSYVYGQKNPKSKDIPGLKVKECFCNIRQVRC